MPSKTLVKFVSAVIMCIVVGAPHHNAEGAVTCGSVTQNLAPCLVYLRTGQGPTPACCQGVLTLKHIAVTTDDKKTACECMKSAAAAISGFKPENIAALPGKCGVSIPVAISPHADCSKVN